MAPKVAGTLNLGDAAWVWPVASSVSFSSIAALLGNAGQANYGGANAAMDAWAAKAQLKVRTVTGSVTLLDKASVTWD